MIVRRLDAFPIRISDADETATGADDAFRLPGNSRQSIYSRFHETCVVRMETDTGVVGWGEAQSPVGALATQALIQTLCAPMVLGTPLFEREATWYRLYSAMRERGHVTGFYVDALAGIDIALHDALGHALGLPVWKLLGGGFSNPIPAYVGVGAEDGESVRRRIEHLRAEGGYRGFKLHLRLPDAQLVPVVTAARQALADDERLMLDLHASRDVAGAVRLCEMLAAEDLYWLESPCLAEDFEGHAEIRRKIQPRVASGEWLRTVWEWRRALDRRAYDVAMPDVARTGFAEGKRIAALCDAASLEVSPHVGGGGIIALAATIHFASCLPNFTMMEHAFDERRIKSRIAVTYPHLTDGVFALPETPGLGIEINEDALHQFRMDKS